MRNKHIEAKKILFNLHFRAGKEKLKGAFGAG
jgi:hypothetical protein